MFAERPPQTVSCLRVSLLCPARVSIADVPLNTSQSERARGPSRVPRIGNEAVVSAGDIGPRCCAVRSLSEGCHGVNGATCQLCHMSAREPTIAIAIATLHKAGPLSLQLQVEGCEAVTAAHSLAQLPLPGWVTTSWQSVGMAGPTCWLNVYGCIICAVNTTRESLQMLSKQLAKRHTCTATGSG